MIKQEYVKCECPVCSTWDPYTMKTIYKEFTYPTNLPHNFSSYEFKFFSITCEDRRRLKYSFIKYLKDFEEITDLIHNLYCKKGIEAVEEFLEKASITEQINQIIERKRELVISTLKEIKENEEFDITNFDQSSKKAKDFVKKWQKIKTEFFKAKHDFEYCLDEKYD